MLHALEHEAPKCTPVMLHVCFTARPLNIAPTTAGKGSGRRVSFLPPAILHRWLQLICFAGGLLQSERAVATRYKTVTSAISLPAESKPHSPPASDPR